MKEDTKWDIILIIGAVLISAIFVFAGYKALKEKEENYNMRHK